MEEVVILGIDIHGIECADIIKRAGMRLIGFISQEQEYPASFAGFPVLGTEDVLCDFSTVGLIPLHLWRSRKYIDRWVTLIDPSAQVSSSAHMGKDCIIYPFCFVGANACLGDAVFMLSGSIVNHDCIIENNVIITSGVMLAGGVTVGEKTYLGQGCNVRQTLHIGKNAFVGMGSVVTRNVPENTTVAGNPARILNTCIQGGSHAGTK